MARERYIPADNQWLQYPEADWEAFTDAVAAELGETVPMSIQPTGEVVVNFEALPPSLSESDVKQAVRDHHPHR